MGFFDKKKTKQMNFVFVICKITDGYEYGGYDNSQPRTG